MIRTNSKRVVMCVTIGLWMLVISGCVSQSEYDTKVIELQNLEERLVKSEEIVAQLAEDLDAAKDRIEQAKQAAKNMESKVEALELENRDLKEQAKTLSAAERRLSERQRDLDDAKSQVEEAKTHASQLQKNLDAAKAQAEEAGNAAKDAEAKIKRLEQENAALKDQVKKLLEAEKKAPELPTEPDAAEAQIE
ncbi:MAG TPA: hypothetical protein DD670_17240 [Planctomycetaceae bacterium]|nr:hypothetical protein [Planctomycetaceae bacterium]